MRTADFSYDAPPELIAQYPAPRRDESRLLCLDRRNGRVTHASFGELAGLLRPGDRLVFNDVKVVPARLRCRKSTGARIEFLCTRRLDERRWEALARPRKRLRAGMTLAVQARPDLLVRVGELLPDGGVLLHNAAESAAASLDEALAESGEVPLPPYIKRAAEPLDRERYQTVYAAVPGAVAAPTAGLHFTPRLMDRLAARGIDFSFVTLDVGIGTFRPVTADDPRDHVMHEESYVLSDQAAAEIDATRRAGGRAVAVGTTVVRVLEQCAGEAGTLRGSRGMTRLKILPGHTFRIVDGLITNFHVSRSTLLMLVCALASRESVLAAYREAVAARYRLFSYGDAMLIL